MEKYLRYKGEFLSRAGVCWRAEIWQERYAAFEEVGALTFEADEALVIEYPDTAKEEVICGSTATLRIESPGDRTYEDLYIIAPRSIRLDVYRDNVLYWSGTLDPEFYEEPYEKAAHYVVSLTFSDFGVLDRLKYTLSGMLTIEDVLLHGLAGTAINYSCIDEGLISSKLREGGTAFRLRDIVVRSDNFYDEDGEALSLRDVLKGILQPLGLRMVQRGGRVYIYDLNGLYTKAREVEAVWSGDSSTMGTDVVYNNAKITWSPYAQSGNLAPEECWTEKTDPNLINLNNMGPLKYEGSDYYSYHYSTDINDWLDATDSGFTIFLNRKGINAELSDTTFKTVRFFKIVPQYDGSESEGVAILTNIVRGYKEGAATNWHAEMQTSGVGVGPAYLAGTMTLADSQINDVIFRSEVVWIPPVDDSGKLLLRVGLELLVDPRFNPFETATNILKLSYQKDYQEQWKKRGNFFYVPVTVKFQPDGSNVIYCWDNRAIVGESVSAPSRTLNQTLGSWKEFDTRYELRPQTLGYFAYYDPADRQENSGVAQGWAVNRQAINPHTAQITTVLEQAENGQYIPYPSGGRGGRLWVEVRGKGWQISDGGVDLSHDPAKIINPYNLWGLDDAPDDKKISWILSKLPTIEIVNNVQFEQTINTDDIEYSAEINAVAKDPIELETICGTSAEGFRPPAGLILTRRHVGKYVSSPVPVVRRK